MINKKEIENIVGSCGVCSFDAVKDNLLPCRKIKELPENSKSIIVFVFPYKVKEEKPFNISRYAAVCDYHTVVQNILAKHCENLKKVFPKSSFAPFCDNSPVPEVSAAVKAGLGVKGKNGLLINDTYGSFVFIGEIVTDLDIEYTSFNKSCLNCGACLSACPVDLCKGNCLSALTQQKKPFTEEQIKLFKKGDSIWGCDICGEICPMNKDKSLTYINEFVESYRNAYIVGEDTTDRPYNWRGKEVIERNFHLHPNTTTPP